MHHFVQSNCRCGRHGVMRTRSSDHSRLSAIQPFLTPPLYMTAAARPPHVVCRRRIIFAGTHVFCRPYSVMFTPFDLSAFLIPFVLSTRRHHTLAQAP
mmetsp:Transcript_26737/g.60464  ORF Transcript_26737/g.60464 Transcript_26737/m.60464 type:complete len:98 (-) Transcript_26737:76-369(-)